MDLTRRAECGDWGDNSAMGVGETSAQEPTPVFDAVLASVRAADQSQPDGDGEGQNTSQAEVPARV